MAKYKDCIEEGIAHIRALRKAAEEEGGAAARTNIKNQAAARVERAMRKLFRFALGRNPTFQEFQQMVN